MRRFIRFLGFSAVLISSAVLGGCSDESAMGDLSSGEEVFFSFAVDDLSEGTVGTSGSDDTRAVDDGDTRDLVKNMWVVQYDSSDEYLSSFYFETFDTTDGIFVEDNTSTIIFIANTFNGDLITESNAGTISDIKDVSYEVSGNDGVLCGDSDKYCVMSGTITNYDPALIPNIILSHNCAKITVTIDDSEFAGFSLKDVTMINVPTRSYAYTDYDTSDIVSASTTYADAPPASSSSRTFYLPINQHGSVDNDISSAKPTHAPDGATAIVLTYDMAHVQRTYTFYLGANMTNDYNLRPNYSYNYTFTITSGNSTTDPRIEVKYENWFSLYTSGSDISGQKFENILIGRTDYSADGISSTKISWYDAESYYPEENAASTGRLPTQKELMAMYAFQKAQEFVYISGYYWSATESGNACYVFFYNGVVNYINKWYTYYARPVKEI